MVNNNQHIWDSIYQQGRMLNRYPYDSVVSFIFKYGKKGQKVLELGCGAGANLWFAAREGFEIIGTDFSQASLDYARARFKQENLQGEFIHCAFPEVPVAENSIDLAVDRTALCCISIEALDKTLFNLKQALKPDAYFLTQSYTPKYSAYHSPYEGTLKGVGSLSFLSQAEIEEVYGRYFNILSLQEVVSTQTLPHKELILSEWIITCTNR